MVDYDNDNDNDNDDHNGAEVVAMRERCRNRRTAALAQKATKLRAMSTYGHAGARRGA